jgi:PAS domain-containing protein
MDGEDRRNNSPGHATSGPAKTLHVAGRGRWGHLSGPFPMWVFDRRTGALLAANDAAVRAYGYRLDDLLKCRLNDICPAAVRTTKLRANEPAWTGPWEQRRKDGTTFVAEMGMLATGDHDPPAAMVIVKPYVETRVG